MATFFTRMHKRVFCLVLLLFVITGNSIFGQIPSGITTTVVPATCNGFGNGNSNGVLSITAGTNVIKFGLSTLNATTYNGPAFSAATAVTSLPATVKNNIPNAGGNYILRVYNTETSFADITINVSPVYCSPVCSNSRFIPLGSNLQSLIWNGTTALQYITYGATNPGVGAVDQQYVIAPFALSVKLPSPSTVTISNLAGFCADKAETIYSGTTYTNYTIVPLEMLAGSKAGEVGTTGVNIPEGGLGAGRSGMIRYLYDQHYISRYADDPTWGAGSQALAFQIALWEITHDQYVATPDFSVKSQIVTGAQEYWVNYNDTRNTAYVKAALDLAEIWVNDIETKTWNWTEYQSSIWNVIGLRSTGNQDMIVVEPISYCKNMDFGDLPDITSSIGVMDYQTYYLAGANHHIVSGLKIGATIDSEVDGQPTSDATGDGTDEDGITSMPTSFTAGAATSINVNVTNTLSSDATLYGFMDWNGDGDFADAGETATANVPAGTSAGTVTITFNIPTGQVFGANVGARFRLSTDAGLTAYGTASNGEVEDYLVKLSCSLGDKVWNDYNGNGLQDSGEPGVAGVTVTLYASDGTTVVATTTTDATGTYLFTQLAPGTYSVKFSNLPADYQFTTTNSTSAGFSDLNDSDADAVTGATGSYTLALGDINRTVDAGLIYSKLRIGNLVWEDKGISDGIYSTTGSTPDVVIPGATVYLYNDANKDNIADGPAISSTTTDINGLYQFTDLKPGNYIVGVVIPGTYVGYTKAYIPVSGNDPNGNVNNDNNGVNTVTGGEVRSKYITISTLGEPAAGSDGDDNNGNLTLDFAFIAPSTISLPSLGFVVTASLNGNTVNVSWKTQTEINSSHFEVERSIDGTNFISLNQQNAAGNSVSEKVYGYMDGAMIAKMQYYRIKLTDLDGKVSYSNVVWVKNSSVKGFSISPNPATSYVNIEFSGVKGSYMIRLVNNAGQQIVQKNVEVVSDVQYSKVEINGTVEKGMYYLIIMNKNSGERFTQKLIIK